MKKDLLILKDENEIIAQIESLREDIDAIQQPRSDFQLEHFVVGSHDMPGRQRAQAVLELQAKLFSIKRSQLKDERLVIEIEDLRAKSDDKTKEGKLASLEAEEKNINRIELELARKGTIREARVLLSILERLPKYTREELQSEEAEYWNRRLSRQSLEDIAASGRVSPGNLDAIVQAHRKIGETQPFDELIRNAQETKVLPGQGKGRK